MRKKEKSNFWGIEKSTIFFFFFCAVLSGCIGIAFLFCFEACGRRTAAVISEAP